MSQDQDEWEYEYHQDATDVGGPDYHVLLRIELNLWTDFCQTFLLDLDLTSLNNRLKSNVPGRRPLDRPVETSNENARSPGAQHETTSVDEHLDATPSSNSNELDNPFAPASNSVQILDLHSHNPLVSYRNEVYSCSWADMVGTNMYFVSTINQWPDAEEPVEMLGMSRVRLVGHKAKAAVKQGTTAEATDGSKRMFKGTSVMPQHKNANTAMKRQADFLGRLMDTKKAKGDMDVVRALVPSPGSPSAPAGALLSGEGAANREDLRKLNRRIVRGDSRALAKLQEMYGQADGPAHQHQDARTEEQLDEDTEDMSSAPSQSEDSE